MEKSIEQLKKEWEEMMGPDNKIPFEVKYLKGDAKDLEAALEASKNK